MELVQTPTKVVTFELYGGVVDTAQHTTEVVQHLFAAYQLTVPYPSSVFRMLKKANMEWEAIFRAAGIVPDLKSIDEVRNDFRQVSRELGGARGIPGIRETLSAFRQNGVECVVVSSLPAQSMERELDRAGLTREDFDEVVSGKRSRRTALQHIERTRNVAPTDVLWIGGMGSDLTPVAACGSRTVRLDPTASRQVKEASTREIRNLAALAERSEKVQFRTIE